MSDSQGVKEPRGGRSAMWTGMVGLAACLVMAVPTAAEAGVQDEIECLALNIYFEARGEPDPGRLAVGHVVMNRVSDNRYPGNVCAVVRQGGERLRNRCQFSWWCDGRSDRPRDTRAWEQSKVIARRIYWGFSDDMTEGALWYHAVYVRPAWRKVLERGRTIGRHIFYRDEAAVRAAVRTGQAPQYATMPPDKALVHQVAGADQATATNATDLKNGASGWLWILVAVEGLLRKD